MHNGGVRPHGRPPRAARPTCWGPVAPSSADGP